MDINGNESEDITALKDWLFERVSDDNDIVVDEMQEEFAAYYDQIEADKDSCFQGSLDYQKNVKLLESSIADLQTPSGKLKIKLEKDKQKITDGIRECWYGGQRNAQGFPHGEGMLAYNNKDVFKGTFNNGVLDREGKLTQAERSGLTIEGKWQNGLMEGEMRIETDFGGWIEGYYHLGVPHGFQREFGYKMVTSGKNPPLHFLGRFYRGVPRGFCWKGLFGGGFICGYVDPLDGSFSGEDLAYIYPDFKTCLRGAFSQARLVRAQICQLIGSKVENGIYIPVFSKPEGQEYEFEAPSKRCIAKNPLLPDPFEASVVFVDESKLPQGGEGLFAKVARPRGSIVSLYNGIRLNTSSALMEARYGQSDYRCRLNAEVDLDIPKGHESLDVYKATLAHKANHSFVANAGWILFEHPRFGLIRGLQALQDIAVGEEILVNYSINLADSPEWYRIIWLRHQKYVKNCSDATIKRILERYEENSCKRVEIPKSEELNIPEPQGIGNLDDLPDELEIEETTNKAQFIKMKAEKNQPKVEELDD